MTYTETFDKVAAAIRNEIHWYQGGAEEALLTLITKYQDELRFLIQAESGI